DHRSRCRARTTAWWLACRTLLLALGVRHQRPPCRIDRHWCPAVLGCIAEEPGSYRCERCRVVGTRAGSARLRTYRGADLRVAQHHNTLARVRTQLGQWTVTGTGCAGARARN